MAQSCGGGRRGGIHHLLLLTALVAASVSAGSCRKDAAGGGVPSPAVLRVGVSQWSTTTNSSQGLRQLNQLLSLENLARTGEDGRMQPWLAESWTRGADGRSLSVKLRHGVMFHDGSRMDAAAVVPIIKRHLKTLWG